jgi:F-type H+-transporting ATPase subunit c
LILTSETNHNHSQLLHLEGNHMEAVAFAWLSAGIGLGITVFGVGSGIGRLAAAALEASSRQPENAGDIRTTMIIGAALIEGVALLAGVVCILLAVKS